MGGEAAQRHLSGAIALGYQRLAASALAEHLDAEVEPVAR